jgi:hypothetical protein
VALLIKSKKFMQLRFDFNIYKYVMIKFNDNWADEMDVESLWVTTGKDFEEFIDIIKENMDQILKREHYCGTNEFLEYSDEAEFWRCFKFVPVSEQFYKEFKKHVGYEEFGSFQITRFMEP